MQENEQNSTSESPTPSTPPVAPAAMPVAESNSNKKLYIIFGAIFGLMLILIGLLAVMLMSKSEPSTSNNSAQQEDTSGSTAKNDSGRKVLLRAPTSDPKLEYVIYEPQQNGSNTTIHFAVENICSGCSGSTGTYMVTSNFSNKSNSFLVDDSNGKKYSLITDEDGEELATPNCGKQIKFGEKAECFASFTKVPSGSTVSWVFGSTRIDNIKVE